MEKVRTSFTRLARIAVVVLSLPATACRTCDSALMLKDMSTSVGELSLRATASRTSVDRSVLSVRSVAADVVGFLATPTRCASSTDAAKSTRFVRATSMKPSATTTRAQVAPFSSNTMVSPALQLIDEPDCAAHMKPFASWTKIWPALQLGTPGAHESTPDTRTKPSPSAQLGIEVWSPHSIPFAPTTKTCPSAQVGNAFGSLHASPLAPWTISWPG